MNDINQAYEFYPLIFENCQGDINNRYIIGDVCTSLFYSSPSDAVKGVQRYLNSRNCYFGVATREGSNGKKDGIKEIPACWVDIDHVTVDEALALFKDFPLRPTVIIATGHGVHVYWRFKEPLGCSDTERVEYLNKQLCDYFKGDTSATDASRILRPPGTYNLKDGERLPVSTIELNKDAAYNLSDFDFLPEYVEPKDDSIQQTASGDTLRVDVLKYLAHYGIKALKPKPFGTSTLYLLGECIFSSSHSSETHRGEAFIGQKADGGLFYGCHHTSCKGKRTWPEARALISGEDSLAQFMFGRTPERPEAKKNKLVCVNLGEFLSMEIPACGYIVEPIITEQGLIMVYAWRGTGKTYFVLYLIAAIASGSPFLKWTVNKPVGCMFLDGEMPTGDLQLRYQKIIAGLENDIIMPIKVIPLGLQTEGMPDIGTLEGQAAYEEHITDDIKIIVIDSLTTLARTGRENEGEGWLAVQAWALKLRSQGKTVIFIHHAGKNREQRGTSRREDVLDTVISLKQPGDAKYQDGRFEIHFEKNRNFTGKDAMPIEVQMTELDTGAMVFTWKTLEVSNYEKVISLYKDGLTSPSDIAEELGINKSNASRHIKKAKSEGLIF